MKPSIAFVGAGPTTIYTLHALIGHMRSAFDLTIFETQAVAGRGTPYRPGWNDPAMLSNIASIELPPLTETLVEWLERQPPDHLRTLGVDPRTVDERAFYPRLALGEFFRDQFEMILGRARGAGIDVDVRTRCRVTDAANRSHGLVLTVKPESGEPYTASFDHVVIATGHQWPDDPEVRPGYFLSPWPASALSDIPACEIGIRGTSLTAIDAAVAIALEHGRFVDDDEGALSYRPGPGTGGFRLTMMSRKGLLPEADFYHPIPYEPLAICTAGAIDTLITGGNPDLLGHTFALFKKELVVADPDYAAKTDLADLTLEDFADRFFADRVAADPFDWAEANLRQAKQDFETETVVGWRYAILRMHEVVERIVPHLDDAAFARFSRFWKPVFIDDYATIPHESIERMIALHRAGRLEILALGEDYVVESQGETPGATLRMSEKRRHFPAFVEATGQRPLQAKDFPFASLRRQGIVRDEDSAENGPSRGIVIDDEFHPVSDDIPEDRLFCLSLPFLLGRHPFSQGITSSHAMGQTVGERLARVVARVPEHVRRVPADEEAGVP